MLMADRAGLAVEHACAYEREPTNVEMLQRSLLPERCPRGGDPDRRRPCRAVPTWAGTGTDAIPLEDGRLGVAMGDVVGQRRHRRSLADGAAFATPRGHALEGHSPGVVLDRGWTGWCEPRGRSMATLLTMVVEPTWSRSGWRAPGHVPSLVVGPDGAAEYLEGALEPAARGVRVGGARRAQRDARARLEPVLYTDGLVEERGVSIDLGLVALPHRGPSVPADPDELSTGSPASKLNAPTAADDTRSGSEGPLPAARGTPPWWSRRSLPLGSVARPRLAAAAGCRHEEISGSRGDRHATEGRL